MEPHREEQPKAPEAGAEPKPKRFRIVKLEERIAPSKGGQGTHNHCLSTTCVEGSCGGCGTTYCTPAPC